jgi:hypothetical protein
MASLAQRIASAVVAISKVDGKIIEADGFEASLRKNLQSASAEQTPELAKELDYWRSEKQQLREEKMLLQAEKNMLVDQERIALQSQSGT